MQTFYFTTGLTTLFINQLRTISIRLKSEFNTFIKSIRNRFRLRIFVYLVKMRTFLIKKVKYTVKMHKKFKNAIEK